MAFNGFVSNGEYYSLSLSCKYATQLVNTVNALIARVNAGPEAENATSFITFTTTGTNTVLFDSFSLPNEIGEYFIHAEDTINNTRQTESLVVAYDGVAPQFTEYGQLLTSNTLLFNVDVEITGDTISVFVIPTTTDTLNFLIYRLVPVLSPNGEVLFADTAGFSNTANFASFANSALFANLALFANSSLFANDATYLNGETGQFLHCAKCQHFRQWFSRYNCTVLCWCQNFYCQHAPLRYVECCTGYQPVQYLRSDRQCNIFWVCECGKHITSAWKLDTHRQCYHEWLCECGKYSASGPADSSMVS